MVEDPFGGKEMGRDVTSVEQGDIGESTKCACGRVDKDGRIVSGSGQ